MEWRSYKCQACRSSCFLITLRSCPFDWPVDPLFSLTYLHTRRLILQVDRNAALDGKNEPLERWRRAVHFVIEMLDTNPMLQSEGVEVEADDKHLETQHWLEMIDGWVLSLHNVKDNELEISPSFYRKHRYGSNRELFAVYEGYF